MIVLISGSRTGFTYKEFVRLFESAVDPTKIQLMVGGGADGIDSIAQTYAIRNGIKFKEMLADWDTFGNSAGAKRNIEMLEYVKGVAFRMDDIEVIAFVNDFSNGTSHMIKNAKLMGLNTKVFEKNSIDFD